MHTTVYTFHINLEFEWDEKKNIANIHARGIDFRDAARAFERPMIKAIDTRRDYGEERWFGLCELESSIIVIVHTIRGHKVRIISMRRASRNERTIYQTSIKKSD